MRRLVDLTGRRFVSLTVLRRGPNSGRVITWYCRCVCKKIVRVRGGNLKSGNTRSCGCLNPHGIRSISHGASVDGKRAPEYRIWSEMIRRCHNSTAPKYKDYGGRDIHVCHRWRASYATFIADMGPRPAGLTIERKKNAKGYTPTNCVWATRRAQANNTRSNRVLRYQGEQRTVAEWARHLKLSDKTIYARLARGWTTKEALT